MELISLKPFEIDDVPQLEAWMYSGAYDDMFRDAPMLTREQLRVYGYMKDGQCFTIWRRDADGGFVDRMGFCVLYEMRAVPGNLKLAILVDQRFQKQGVCLEAMRLACDYVFNTLNFYKLIVEVLCTNKRLRELCEKGGGAIEATLKHEAKSGGQYADVVRYALFRDDFIKLNAEGRYGG